MGRIYKSCQECLVYLGQSLHGADGAPNEPKLALDFGAVGRHNRRPGLYDVFEFFHRLSNSNHFHQTLPLYGEQEEANVEPDNHTDQKIRLGFFEALRMFMHAPFTPWWTRIWVIQEVALPPEVIVLYGAITAPWAMFAKAAKEYQIHSNTCCREAIRDLPRDQERVLNNSFETIFVIQDLRLRYHSNRPESEHLTLLDLLRQFHDRRASDPREKVYALLSMAQVSPGGEPLTPDYSMSEAEVFRKATLDSIYSTKSLSVFSTELGRKFRSDLPSWIPDWGAPGGHTYLLRAKMIKHYNASLAFATPVSVIPVSFQSLYIRGKRIMQVEKVGEIMWGDDLFHTKETLHQWWPLWRTHLREMNLEPSSMVSEYAKRSERLRTYQFWKTMCAGVLHEHVTTSSTRSVQAEDMTAFETWAKYSRISPFSRPEDVQQASSWSAKAELWSLFLSIWPTAPDKKVTDEPINSYIPSHLEDSEAACNALIGLLQIPELETVSTRFGDQRSSFAWHTLYLTAWYALRDHYGDNICIYSDRYKYQIPSIDRSISIATLSRRLVCSNKWIGLGPADMARYGGIFLLHGGKTPFVLRPTVMIRNEIGYQTIGNTSTYEIIGDRYLDGLMGGAIDLGDWRNIKLR